MHVATVPKSNLKIVERWKMDIPKTEVATILKWQPHNITAQLDSGRIVGCIAYCCQNTEPNRYIFKTTFFKFLFFGQMELNPRLSQLYIYKVSLTEVIPCELKWL